MTARTCKVKGTGWSGIAIWAATAVTAAINAARVMVDALNAILSALRTVVYDRPLLRTPFTILGPWFPASGNSERGRLVFCDIGYKKANALSRVEEEQVGLLGDGGKDKDEGAKDRAKGRMKEAAGTLTGDKDTKSKGRADQRRGKAKEKKGNLKDLL
jgi:uncharacterized protein YjbJ (UPF0337 family)